MWKALLNSLPYFVLRGVLDIANSFAVPFDEDDKDKDVWFLDHEYLEIMYNMFKKVKWLWLSST